MSNYKMILLNSEVLCPKCKKTMDRDFTTGKVFCQGCKGKEVLDNE